MGRRKRHKGGEEELKDLGHEKKRRNKERLMKEK